MSRNLDPFLIVTYYIKKGQAFLDIRYGMQKKCVYRCTVREAAKNDGLFLVARSLRGGLRA